MSDLISLLQASPTMWMSVCGVLGLLVGSFLNVVIYRLPIMMENDWRQQCEEFLQVADANQKIPAKFNLLVPSSACPKCKHEIRAWENIPVLSYLILRGRCSGCHASISPRYPIIEALTGLMTAYAAAQFGFGLWAAASIVLLWALIALTMIDFDTHLLPDDITLPLLWLGLLFNMYGGFVDLKTALLGAVFGYLSLWSVYWLFKLLTGKEGMGYGDFKLLAALGAWLGWKMLPLIILSSSLVGAIVGISLMILAKRGREVPIPFGPYLAGGGVIALFWGERITQSYIQSLAMH